MNILAIDTATAVLSVALSSEQGNWYAEADSGPRHSEFLMDMIDGMMKTAGLAPGDLDCAACMRGPGSFTGLRIGFSAAKGLALALGIPLVSVPTLDCMALFHSPWPGVALPLIDAKKRRFFTALYRGAGRISGYLDADIPEIVSLLPKEGGVLLTGPGADMFASEAASVFPPERIVLDPGRKKGAAKELLEIASKGTILNNSGDDLFSAPWYLRKSDAELNSK
jgi:tRNA threonylcarbamoyladenosine biosynthesis protein TsaB